MGKDEPTVWFEAAAALPQLNKNSRTPLSDTAAEQLRQRAEALLDQEQQLFEREMGSRNAADARWLAQVMEGCSAGGVYNRQETDVTGCRVYTFAV